MFSAFPGPEEGKDPEILAPLKALSVEDWTICRQCTSLQFGGDPPDCKLVHCRPERVAELDTDCVPVVHQETGNLYRCGRASWATPSLSESLWFCRLLDRLLRQLLSFPCYDKKKSSRRHLPAIDFWTTTCLSMNSPNGSLRGYYSFTVKDRIVRIEGLFWGCFIKIRDITALGNMYERRRTYYRRMTVTAGNFWSLRMTTSGIFKYDTPTLWLALPARFIVTFQISLLLHSMESNNKKQ